MGSLLNQTPLQRGPCGWGLMPGVLQLDMGWAWTRAVVLPVGFKILLKKILYIIYIIKDNLEIKTY